MKLLSLVVLLLISLTALAQHSRIFPQPASMEMWAGSILRTQRLTLPESPDNIRLVDALKINYQSLGIELNTGANANVDFEDADGTPAEGYELSVKPEGIVITTSSDAGKFYALQSLLWLYDEEKQGFLSGWVKDAPRFSWRGAHLDCSRHFFSTAEIKTFLDRLALFKINKFHWHLTDDQGWRIEIKKYPQLTSRGAWREQTLVGHFSEEPDVYDGTPYSGFYTQEDAREIVAYAQKLYIEVIPEIEMPGHALAALTAYPELGCTGGPYGVAQTWGVFDDIFCSSETTRAFLKNVLGEIADLFPSEIIHIGGDEAPKLRWDSCPKCAAVRAENHLSDSHELQSFFIQDMVNFLATKGKRLIGWDEILEGGLPTGAAVMSWRGTEGGTAAARAKHDVVMTPTGYCYFDYYQSGSPKEPLCIGGYLPIEKVYGYEPVPPGLAPDEARHILGVQANMWTEYLPDINRVYEQLFPRLFAFADVSWSTSRPSFDEFAQALSTGGLTLLNRLNIPFSKACLYPTVVTSASPKGVRIRFVPSVGGVKYKSKWSENGETVIQCFGEPVEMSTYVYMQLNEQTIDSTLFTLFAHPLLGLPVKFMTAPNEKYNVNAEVALTDGILGARPWKGNQWLGFDTSTVQFTFMVPEKQRFRHFQIGFLDDPGSWIYLPEELVMEKKAADGFTEVYRGRIDQENLVIPVKMKPGEYRVTINNAPVIPSGKTGAGFTPWTFIDEFYMTK